MAAIVRRTHPRPWILLAAALAVTALTVAIGGIFGDEPSLRAAGIAALAGLAAIVVADRGEGADTVRLFGASGALLAVPVALLALVPTPGAGAERLAGADRTATAIAVSGHVFDSAEAVVVVGATSAADAVAGAPLASAVRGPLLLTGEGTAAEVSRLEATRAYVVGAAAADPAVAEELRDAGVREVIRVSGADRYATSAAVASRIRPDRVVVTSAWPDAIAAAPITRGGGAIVTVTPDAVPTSVAEVLQRLDPSEVVVVGGEAAVSEEVEAFLGALLPDSDVRRLAGADRWATSVAVLEATDGPADWLWVASGESWPDALAASVGSSAQSRPLLLVPSGGASPSADSVRWLVRNRTDLRQVTVVGGDEAVSPSLVDRITR